MRKPSEEVKLLWSYKTGATVNSVAIKDGYVAAGFTDRMLPTFPGKLCILDYSGELLWSYETGGVSSVAITDGYVAVESHLVEDVDVDKAPEKKIYLFDYSGKLLWSYDTGGWVFSIAIGDGYVAAGTGRRDNKVYLFDYSGKLLWCYEAGSSVFSSVNSVAIRDGYVAAGSSDKKVYLFNYSGELLWCYEADSSVGTVAIQDGYVAAGSSTKVYLFDYSGKLLWSYTAGGTVLSVAIEDGYVAAGSKDKKVYLFDYSGKLLGSYETGDWVNSIAIKDGYVAAGSDDKKVYLFDVASLLFKVIQNLITEANKMGCKIAQTESLEVLLEQRQRSEALEIATKEIAQIKARMADFKEAEKLHKAIQNLITEANQIGCKIAQPESLELFEQGEYAKAAEIARKDINYIRMTINDFNELNSQIKSAESAIADAKEFGCEVTEAEELLNRAKSAVSAGNYREGITIVKETNERIKERIAHFNELNNQIISAESAIEGAKELGCEVAEAEELLNQAKSVLSAGNYKEGISITKNNIIETKTEERLRDFKELNSQIKSAEVAIGDARKFGDCGVAEAEELLKQAKSALSAGNYQEGITVAKNVIEQSRRLRASARPEITLHLTKHNFRPNYWEKVDIILKNTGTAHAKAINLSFSKEVEVKGLKELDLNIGDEQRLSITLTPKNAGEIPLEVDIKYEDLDGKAYDTKSEFILSVGEIKREPKEEVPAQSALPPGLAENYHDIQLIGQGGFAKVFKTVRKRDNKEVAIKIPISLDQATGKTFIEEIKNWTRLNHPNIVKIYDYNILPIPFFEMELCDSSLDEYIKDNKDKRIQLNNACWIIFNAAEGLKPAHSLKIIHRDLKPQNILLKDGMSKLTDWGLSKVITESGGLSGFTPPYAAPEQISGKQKDERTDIWQLGVIFYQITTGKLPFAGEDIAMSILTKEPVSPSELNPEIDPELEKIILKPISKEPEGRYQSIREFQMALATYLQISLKQELSKSVSAKDSSKSAYYCADLLMVYLKTNDGVNAYKYIDDLINYATGDVKDELIALKEGIE